MFDRYAAHLQRVRYQRTMAAPRHGLGAHDDSLLARSELHQPLKSGFELRRLHVIGEPPERGVMPSSVLRVRACMAQPSQLLHVGIGDARKPQCLRQRVAIELRVVARARDSPHIHKVFHAVGLEQFDEGVERSRRMADGQDRGRSARHVRRPDCSHPAFLRSGCAGRATAPARRTGCRCARGRLRGWCVRWRWLPSPVRRLARSRSPGPAPWPWPRTARRTPRRAPDWLPARRTSRVSKLRLPAASSSMESSRSQAMSGIITFSSKLPAAAHQAMAASCPITCAHTISRLSAITGLTLPGMMLEPGCTAGRRSSPMPQRGPEPSQRMSLAILVSATAQLRSAPLRKPTASRAACASKWLGASRNGRPVRAASSAITAAAKPAGAFSPVPTAVPPSGSSYMPGSASLMRSSDASTCRA